MWASGCVRGCGGRAQVSAIMPLRVFPAAAAEGVGPLGGGEGRGGGGHRIGCHRVCHTCMIYGARWHKHLSAFVAHAAAKEVSPCTVQHRNAMHMLLASGLACAVLFRRHSRVRCRPPSAGASAVLGGGNGAPQGPAPAGGAVGVCDAAAPGRAGACLHACMSPACPPACLPARLPPTRPVGCIPWPWPVPFHAPAPSASYLCLCKPITGLQRPAWPGPACTR